MDYEPYIRLIDSHPEGNSCYDDYTISVYETVLMEIAIFSGHTGMVGIGIETLFA